MEQALDYKEGKEKFIQSWGAMGSCWGISRTMAQVHALLLVSPDPLCADDIMDKLSISRGNANMNLRALVDWRLVRKVCRTGERRDYFEAEKDMWEVFRRIIIERKKKELEPMVKIVEELSTVESNCPESDEFCRIIRDINLFSKKADTTLTRLCKSDSRWFMGTFLKMI